MNTEKVPLKSWIAVIGVALGAFMAVLDIQITNSSLAEIQGALGATLEEGSWIATSYLVAEIIVIPLTGWLSKVFSIRRYLIFNAVCFIFFSVCCAWAWDLQSMIVFRALQGITGGVLIPMAFSTILTTLPPSKQPVGMAMYALTATFAPSIGPGIGGWLTDNFGWQYIFYLNIVPGILLVAALWYALPKEKLEIQLLRQGDWLGIAGMALGLGCLEVVLEEGNRKDWFESELIVRLAILSVIGLAIFLWTQLKGKKPFINLRLLGRRNFGVASVANVTLGAALYGSIYLMPLYLAQIQGYNALQIGQVLMMLGLPQLFIVPLVPKIMQKVDGRLMVGAGLLLFASSSFINSTMTNLTGFDQLMVSQLVRALGQPLIMIPLSSIATAGMEKAEVGSGSALFNMMRNLGGSIGIATISTLLTRREQLHSNRIGEHISLADPETQERIQTLTNAFIARGSDAVQAYNQSLKAIDAVVRRESFVMAYNDCFYVLAFALLLSTLTVFLLQRVQPGQEPSASH
jgi:DHA2 family multidrug resistance protein